MVPHPTASHTAPRLRLAERNANRRLRDSAKRRAPATMWRSAIQNGFVEMWKSQKRIPTFPQSTLTDLTVEGRFIEGTEVHGKDGRFRERRQQLCGVRRFAGRLAASRDKQTSRNTRPAIIKGLVFVLFVYRRRPWRKSTHARDSVLNRPSCLRAFVPSWLCLRGPIAASPESSPVLCKRSCPRSHTTSADPVRRTPCSSADPA